MSGDFIGIPEFNNDESYFCADFYRADQPIESRDFLERIRESDTTTARGPFGKGLKNITKIAFIFDETDELSALTSTDMYKPENSSHPMQEALKLLESYKGEKNGQVAAIPYGIPSAFISGIIAGDSLLQDEKYIEMLQEMFPGCYILNRDGKIFFSPELTSEQNKQNQLKCLDAIPQQEGWRQERINKTMEHLLSQYPNLHKVGKFDPKDIGNSTLMVETTKGEIDSVTGEIRRDYTKDLQQEQQK